MDIEKRARMAAESILENEAIREGLDDNGASALLDWGTACAVRISRDTSSIEDNDEAQEAVYPRMHALRQMLDIAKELCKPETDINDDLASLTQLMEKATVVYGKNTQFPQQIFWNMYSAIKSEDAGQTISALRAMIEENIQTQE
jgi:hypothetical protein